MLVEVVHQTFYNVQNILETIPGIQPIICRLFTEFSINLWTVYGFYSQQWYCDTPFVCSCLLSSIASLEDDGEELRCWIHHLILTYLDIRMLNRVLMS